MWLLVRQRLSDYSLFSVHVRVEYRFISLFISFVFHSVVLEWLWNGLPLWSVGSLYMTLETHIVNGDTYACVCAHPFAMNLTD